MAGIPLEKAALILAEAEFDNDETVASRWGISSRTIRTYRTEVAKDPHFSLIFRQKVKEISDRHTENVSQFLSKNLKSLTRIIDISLASLEKSEEIKADPISLIKAVTAALDTVGGIKLGAEVINGESSSENTGDSETPEDSTVSSTNDIRTAEIPNSQRTPRIQSIEEAE